MPLDGDGKDPLNDKDHVEYMRLAATSDGEKWKKVQPRDVARLLMIFQIHKEALERAGLQLESNSERRHSKWAAEWAASHRARSILLPARTKKALFTAARQHKIGVAKLLNIWLAGAGKEFARGRSAVVRRRVIDSVRRGILRELERLGR